MGETREAARRLSALMRLGQEALDEGETEILLGVYMLETSIGVFRCYYS
jgi:hypothetical protein